MVPHFVTALTGPLLDLERRVLDATAQIERWFRLEWQEHTPPFYSAVDLRNAGYKIAAVDTDLFPRGFDNLSDEMMPLAVQSAMAAIEKYCPDARALLLIPERRSDTRYLRSLDRLARMLRQTGLSVRFGSIEPDQRKVQTLALPDGKSLTIEPVQRQGRRLMLNNFDPCTILLNNDLSEGKPAILESLYEQTLLPPAHAGWDTRRKSNHLAAYQDVCKKFAKAIDIDPWLVNPYFTRCEGVDLLRGEGAERLATGVDTVLRQMRSRYREYGIKDAPFVVVKANKSTCGRAVMSVRDPAEIGRLDGKMRERLSIGRDGRPVNDLIVQEGVPTVETIDGDSAEPVVYMIDRYVVGGFYRANGDKGRDENLSAPGEHFEKLAFAGSCNLPDSQAPGNAQNRFYAYGVVARLGMLAASIELERTDPDQSLYG